MNIKKNFRDTFNVDTLIPNFTQLQVGLLRKKQVDGHTQPPYYVSHVQSFTLCTFCIRHITVVLERFLV
jgi:hypothetical protein